MLKIDRQAIIEKEILEKGSILISKISEMLNCSEETIRRDLREMEKKGKLVRIYGGAYLLEKYDKGAPIQLRESFYNKEKSIIANRCLSYIKESDTLMLDSSSTCLELAKTIKMANMKVTIITNSLKICSLFTECISNVNVICIGGKLNFKNSCFLGYQTTDSLCKYFADKSFISCPSIDLDYGLSDNNIEQSKIREIMLKNSKQKFVIADHTKFSKVSDILFYDIKNIDVIITDTRLNNELERGLIKEGIQINYCKI